MTDCRRRSRSRSRSRKGGKSRRCRSFSRSSSDDDGGRRKREAKKRRIKKKKSKKKRKHYSSSSDSCDSSSSASANSEKHHTRKKKKKKKNEKKRKVHQTKAKQLDCKRNHSQKLNVPSQHPNMLMLSFMKPLSTGYVADRENASGVYRGWQGRNSLSENEFKDPKRKLTSLEILAKKKDDEDDN